jgi:hypothetical protein
MDNSACTYVSSAFSMQFGGALNRETRHSMKNLWFNLRVIRLCLERLKKIVFLGRLSALRGIGRLQHENNTSALNYTARIS